MLRKFMTAFSVVMVSLNASAVNAQIGSPLEQLDEEQLSQTVNFVLGNTSFELFRQASAAVIDDLALKARDPEKNVVDELTTVLMFEMNDIWMETSIVNATDSWFLGRDQNLLPQHATPEHLSLVPLKSRDQNIACLMVGKDREAYSDLAETMNLPKERWDECVSNYPAIVTYWDEQLQPFRSDDVQGDFILTYVDSSDSSLADYATMIQESKVLDMVARSFETYSLKVPIHIVAKSCGRPDVFWSKADRQITLCYEYAKYQGELVAAHLIKASVDAKDIGLDDPVAVKAGKAL